MRLPIPDSTATHFRRILFCYSCLQLCFFFSFSDCGCLVSLPMSFEGEFFYVCGLVVTLCACQLHLHCTIVCRLLSISLLFLLSYFHLFKTYVQLTNGSTWIRAITIRGNRDLLDMVTGLVWLKHLRCFCRLALVMNWDICRFAIEDSLSNRDVRINNILRTCTAFNCPLLWPFNYITIL